MDWAEDSLLCVRSHPGDTTSHIWRLDWKGNRQEQVTQGAVFCVDPALSRDGKKIAYITVGPPDIISSDVWICNPDGTDARPLTAHGDGQLATCPTWSPDGRFLAFCLSQGRQGAVQSSWINVLDIATGEVNAVVEGRYPSWSPEPGKVCYTLDWFYEEEPHRGQVSINLPGLGHLDFIGIEGMMPDWSWDGQRVVAIDWLDQERIGLLVHPADDPANREILLETPTSRWGDDLRISAPKWRKDGRSICFSRWTSLSYDAPHSSEIVRYDLDTGSTTTLSSPGTVEITGEGLYPIWLRATNQYCSRKASSSHRRVVDTK